jgi:type IV pilus assembly protein PilC
MDLAGIPAQGEVEAVSRQDVADQLKARGLIVLDIANKYRSMELNIRLPQRVKVYELAVATRQLATMVSSGVTILRALHVLESQTKSKLLAETLREIRQDVEAGALLSSAMERHPKVFSPLYVAMVKTGEAGGLLESTLVRTADQLEKDAALRRQVRSAMIYPSLIVSFATIVLLALVAFLIPVFEKVFKQFGGQLPALTKLMVGVSHTIRDQWYLVILLLALGVGGFIFWKRSKLGRAQWDRIKLRFPLKIGDVVQKVAIARWARTLSSLTSAGVPVMQALDIVGKTAGNTVVEGSMDKVVESVKAGGTISAPLRESKVFPPMVAHMVGVGEETGALDAMLAKLADFYEDEVAAAIKALTSILEPVMIIFVGSVVGLIVVSMYLPLFNVYNQIR